MSTRYVMRQKLLAFGDDFTIRAENGDDVYFVDGQAFSLGHKLSFQDMNGNELAFIKQKLLTWGPTYEIYVQGELAAVVTKEIFTFFKCRFHVDVEGPNDIEATGDFLEHEYHFERNGAVIGTVTKAWFSFSDSYGVEVSDPRDAVTILVAAIVIDLSCHHEDK